MTSNNKIVLFADILGFAHLTETYPVDIDRCSVGDGSLDDLIGEIFQENHNNLARTFSAFHSSLRGVLNLARLSHPYTAVTFSDSVFVATEYAYEAVKIAIDLIHSLLPQKIPIRIGIAYGTFAAVRFRSDVSLKSGDHAAQFLGTAIVRAHAAESCGIKGIRILLHPSMNPLLNDIRHNPSEGKRIISYIECPEDERVNKAHIVYEINYWSLPPTKESNIWRGLQDLWNQAPVSEMAHYEATANAVNRMRMSKGYNPLNNLRRRVSFPVKWTI